MQRVRRVKPVKRGNRVALQLVSRIEFNESDHAALIAFIEGYPSSIAGLIRDLLYEKMLEETGQIASVTLDQVYAAIRRLSDEMPAKQIGFSPVIVEEVEGGVDAVEDGAVMVRSYGFIDEDE